jgi:CubicO group peptidase (beta-lactamase class C family)
VSGKPFDTLMDQLVLDRIGMENSSFEQPLTGSEAAHAAPGHDKDGNAIEGGWHSYPEKDAAGLWTTPTDLAQFAISVALADQGKASPVPTEVARLLLQAQKGVGFGKNNMALGVALRPAGDVAAFWHSGGNEGYRAYLVMFPETGQGAVIMANGDRGDELYREIVRGIASEYHWPDTFQKQFDARAMRAEELQEYAGSYRIEPNNGASLVFNVEDGQLRAQGPGGQKFHLRAAGDGHFFSPSDGTEIYFERNAQRGIARVTVKNDSLIMTAVK